MRRFERNINKFVNGLKQNVIFRYSMLNVTKVESEHALKRFGILIEMFRLFRIYIFININKC